MTLEILGRGGFMMNSKFIILCVDDEPAILKILEILLVANGYEFLKAENGVEALKILLEERVDLVLMDVMMPRVDGFEVCRRIKADDRYRNIPVVLITGLTSKEDRIKGIEAGAEDFLTKPLDAAEVLARIKMLLKSKSLYDRRIGELLIDMGFITEQQLQEALTISREQKIKVGEVLTSMGALDKDHIYWVLSTQLQMNYVELSPDMIDGELVRQFPIATLEELLCLPLYETAEEIHFAIADPTNHKIVKEVKSLKPHKSVRLNLALPQKIADILNSFKPESELIPPPPKIVQPEKPEILHPPGAVPDLDQSSPSESSWNDFAARLFSMSPGEVYWFYETSRECRLILQKGGLCETVHQYPQSVYPLIRKQLEKYLNPRDGKGQTLLFLQHQVTQQQGAFNVWPMNGPGRVLIRFQRLLLFSGEKLVIDHPPAPDLIRNLQQFLAEHPRLLIGGRENLLIKQCYYSFLQSGGSHLVFPPPLFVEGRVEMIFPDVVQLTHDALNKQGLLSHCQDSPHPFVFYENELPDFPPEEITRIFSRAWKNFVFYVPFPSLDAMQKALAGRQDWQQAGFHALFFHPYQWQSIAGGIPCPK